MKHTDKVLVIGAGYVGLAYTCFFSQIFKTTVLDIDKNKIKQIKECQFSAQEESINIFLKRFKKNIKAESFIDDFSEYDLALLCLPTDYDDKTNFFDTSTLKSMIKNITEQGFKGLAVIKSTVPVGFTEEIQKNTKEPKIIFSPEFLREGTALNDILNPSRIVVGGTDILCKKYLNYVDLAMTSMTKKFIMNSTEAEAVKLFANTYLAMRISFFNELDSFCIEKNLGTKDIIGAICEDNRIGQHYNNPSFGYGGYCLPKDTKQLLANYENVPQNLIESIVQANQTRKNFISDTILRSKVKNIGIYRLVMKKDSDNLKESSILSILNTLKENNLNVYIYEPLLENKHYLDCEVISDIEKFKEKSELIIANRTDEELRDCHDKLFTRDIFQKE